MHQYMLARHEIKEKAKAAISRDRSYAILNWFLYSAILVGAFFAVGFIGGNPLGGIMRELMYGVSGNYFDEQAIWGLAQAVYGIFLSALLSSSLIFAINFIAAPILRYGVYYNSIRIYRGDRGGKIELRDLFIGFRVHFARNLGGHLWRALFLFLWGLIPFAGTIIATIKSYAYCMTPFILIEHPEIDARQALKESIKMTEGHKWDLFVMDLSFLGWDILDYLTGGILGIFYVTPYKGVTFAGYYTEYEKKTIGSGSRHGVDKGRVLASVHGSLMGTKGCYAGARFDMSGISELTIGRSPSECQIIFPSKETSISRVHVKIRFAAKENCYYIKDYSRNGTYTSNGERYPNGQSQRASRGTVIYLDKHGHIAFLLE